MDARTQSFDEACAEAVHCGCVVAGSHISGLLKALAAAPEALAVVRAAAKNYDFSAEFNRSKVPGGVSGYRLLPPARAEEFVAYAFGVLLHIDLGDLDLPTLLATYFTDASSDVNAAYAHFADAIIDRFRRTVLELAGAGEAGGRLRALRQTIAGCAAAAAGDLPSARREELAALCGALTRALDGEDRALTRALYVGFRYTLRACGCPETGIERVGDLLAACGLV